MDYTVDEEKFQMAIEDISSHGLFSEALSKGWKPDFQKAIDDWHTACLELEIGEGYVEHILEEHPENDIIFRMESVLATQADEFLAQLEDEPTICQMNIVGERQTELTNSGTRITAEISKFRKLTILPPTLFYAVELDQTNWCIGAAMDEIDDDEDTEALARTSALDAAAILDMVQNGMRCECGKHRIEYMSIPWGDSFLTGYVQVVIE